MYGVPPLIRDPEARRVQELRRARQFEARRDLQRVVQRRSANEVAHLSAPSSNLVELGTRRSTSSAFDLLRKAGNAPPRERDWPNADFHELPYGSNLLPVKRSSQKQT